MEVVSLICLFKNNFFGIVFSHEFAVYHMNNTSFSTKVKRPDSFKVEKFLGLKHCNAIQSHARIFFSQVTTPLSVKEGWILASNKNNFSIISLYLADLTYLLNMDQILIKR